MPTKISASTANSIGSDVYVFGGHNEVSTKSVYVLRKGTNSWELLPDQLHQKRASHVSVALFNKGFEYQIKCYIKDLSQLKNSKLYEYNIK